METGGDDGARGDFRRAAANDSSGSEAGAGAGPEARVEDAVMHLARLLGRQIAREHFMSIPYFTRHIRIPPSTDRIENFQSSPFFLA